MEFIVNRKELISCLDELDDVRVSASTYRAISFIMCEVLDGRLSLEATNYDVSAYREVEIEHISEGGGWFSISDKTLKTVLKDLKEEMVQIDVQIDGEDVKFVIGDTTISGMNLPVDEFPVFDKVQQTGYFVITDSQRFGKVLKKTLLSMSLKEEDFILNGVYCDFKENAKHLVSTDKHTLIEVDVSELISGEVSPIIISSGMANHIAKYIEKWEAEKIFVKVGEKQIQLIFKGGLISGKLIVGDYPDYKGLFMERKDFIEILLDMKKWKSAIKFMKKFVKIGKVDPFHTPDKVVTLDFTDGNVEISGERVSKKISDGYTNSLNTVINFNYGFLARVLDQVESVDLKMIFWNPKVSVQFEHKLFDCEVQSLLMPVRNNVSS